MSDDEYERRYMSPGERVVFREKVVSRTAFRLAVAFALTFALVGLIAVTRGASSPSGAVPPGLLVGALSLIFGASMGVLGVMFSVFRVMLTSSHFHVHFGWSKRKIALESIQDVHAVKLTGFRQGKVTIGLDGVVRTWVGQSKSGRGVEVTYQEPGGRRHILTIGSENADALVTALEAARVSETQGRIRVEGASSPEPREDEHEPASESGATSRRASS